MTESSAEDGCVTSPGSGPTTDRACDGPECNARLSICPPVINAQHDVAFCSLGCRSDWGAENEGVN